MSIFTKIGHFLKGAPAADRVVAALKKTALGDAVIDSINAVASKQMTGAQKFEAVVAEMGPRVVDYVRAGGTKAVVADVEDLTRALVQQTYLEIKSVGFEKIVGALLKLLKL